MDFSISGLQFGIGTLLLVGFVGVVILFLRQYLASNTTKNEGSSRLTKKYASANVLKSTGTFWRIGLVCAVAFSILAFSWTTYSEEFVLPDYVIGTDEIEMNIPPTIHTTPPPPPPPPPTVVEEVEETIEEPPTFTDQTVTKEMTNKASKPKTKKKPKPTKRKLPKVKKPKEKITKIFQVVEQMPRFPGCEGVGGSDANKKACADKKMLEYIYKNIKYPTIARENGVEGMAVISFVVEPDGSISNMQIVRDPGAGLGEEALRVVEKMQNLPQKWIPGKQRNENVRVQFNLPVKFRLE